MSIAVFDLSTAATQRAVNEVLLTEAATRRYVAGLTYIGQIYIIAFASAQQAGLRANIDLQNVVLQALRAVLEATLQWSRVLIDRPVPPFQNRGHRSAPVAAGEPISRGRRLPPLAAEESPTEPTGVLASALAFQPPLGMVLSGFAAPDDVP